MRHGATAHSGERRFSGRNELPLGDDGRAQAAALAERDFGTVSAVLSSPLRRAQETAAAIAGRLGLRVDTHEGLVELDFGDFEGLTGAEARASFPEQFAAWNGAPDVAPPGGESFVSVADRVAGVRDEALAAHRGGTVLLVTHVTPIKTLLRLALEAPPVMLFRLFLDIASVSVVDYAADGTPSVRLVNDTGHLR